MKLVGYKSCNTCKKVEKLMNEKNLDYDYREIDKDTLNKDELKKLQEESGLEVKKFFNTCSAPYKANNLKDKLKDMSEDEKFEMLAEEPMLIKRPILIDDNKVYVGPDVKKHIENL